WDLAHNPAGRALVLHDLLARTHDTVLMGPLWGEHGRRLWRPLRDHIERPVAYATDDFGAFFAHGFMLAARSRVDTVHIGKARLPGLVLGAMVQHTNRASLVLDIDDEETAFFSDDVDVLDRFADPTGGEATRWAHHQIAGVPVHTVSNIELRGRYGGIIVRHARDENRFDPAVTDRAAGRARLGAGEEDFVVLFVGTPRPHKGLDQVVDAMGRLDDRFVLHVVGAADPQAAAAELGRSGVSVRTHPPCDFDTLPDLLAGADALALLQDPADPIARFQIPAKISDGLALGKPVFVAATPPLADLAGVGFTVVAGPDSLAAGLREAADGPDPTAAAARRQGFLGEFSHGVNGARLEAAHREAAGHDATPWSVAVLEDAREGYEIHRRRHRPDLFESTEPASLGGADVAFFWKQNDSDIYGRRADMIADAMARSPRFGRIVHFDAPVDVRTLAGELDRPTDELPEETAWVHQNVLDRHLGMIDRPGFDKRVFVFSDHGDNDPLTGAPLPTSDQYPDFVSRRLHAAGLDPATTMAWVCPIAPGFDQVADAIDFGAVVVDIIDDQRVLHPRRSDAQRIDDAYARLIPGAAAVFTNCEPNVAAFAEHADTIHVVPNGADVARLARAVDQRRTEGDRRVVYVGDMRSRIDWTLVEEVVGLLDDHHFVFAGSTDGRSDAVARLAALDNVEFLGVVPHTEVPDLLARADVAIVPHLQGPMTERMNPLKVYTYLAAGLPVVATAVENIEDLAGRVVVTSGAGEFARAVADAEADPAFDPNESLASIDWTARLDDIVEHLEADGVFDSVGKDSGT
ncbi:MAG: glycosyltransferase, partial [Acidimicrobiales bacterium]